MSKRHRDGTARRSRSVWHDSASASAAAAVPVPLEFSVVTIGGRALARCTTPRFVVVHGDARALGGVLGVLGGLFASVLPLALPPTGLRVRAVADDGAAFVDLLVSARVFLAYDCELAATAAAAAAHVFRVPAVVFRAQFSAACTLELATQATAGSNNVLCVRECARRSGVAVRTTRVALLDDGRDDVADDVVDGGDCYECEFALSLVALATVVDDVCAAGCAHVTLEATADALIVSSSLGALVSARASFACASEARSRCRVRVATRQLRRALALGAAAGCAQVRVALGRAPSGGDMPLRVSLDEHRVGVSARVLIAPVADDGRNRATDDAALQLAATAARLLDGGGAAQFVAVHASASQLGRLLALLVAPSGAVLTIAPTSGLRVSARDESLAITVSATVQSAAFVRFECVGARPQTLVVARGATLDAAVVSSAFAAATATLTLASASGVLALQARRQSSADECGGGATTTTTTIAVALADASGGDVALRLGDEAAALAYDVVYTVRLELLVDTAARAISQQLSFALGVDALVVTSRRANDALRHTIAVVEVAAEAARSGGSVDRCAFAACDAAPLCCHRRLLSAASAAASERRRRRRRTVLVETAHVRRGVALAEAGGCSHLSLAFGATLLCLRGHRRRSGGVNGGDADDVTTTACIPLVLRVHE